LIHALWLPRQLDVERMGLDDLRLEQPGCEILDTAFDQQLQRVVGHSHAGSLQML
jgi:hypothetical protein